MPTIINNSTIRSIKAWLDVLLNLGVYREGVDDYGNPFCNCYKCRSNYSLNDPYLQDRISEVFHIIYGMAPFLYDRRSRVLNAAGRRFIQGHYDLKKYIVPIFQELLDTLEYNNFCFSCGTPNVKYTSNINACKSCLDKYFEKCVICNDYITIPVTIYIDGKKSIVCKKCFEGNILHKCVHCRNFTAKDPKNKGWLKLNKYNQYIPLLDEDSSNLYICASCARENIIHKCSKCKIPSLLNHGFCGKCFVYEIPIHNYDFKPEFTEYFDNKNTNKYTKFTDKIYFGLELEYENVEMKISRQDASKIIKTKWPEQFLYCVHDGSLETRENGLELVTMPFSLNHWKDNYHNWVNILKTIQNCGFKGDNMKRAGCHIHISQSAFTRFHIYKFCKFIFSKLTRDLILTVSNRADKVHNEYWSFDSSRYGDIKLLAKDKRNKMVDVVYNNRRTAVNVTDKTIELRMFQSTNIIEILSMYLEFSIGLLKFTRDCSPKQLLSPFFIQYIKQHESLYMNLINYLQKHYKGDF